MVLIQPPIYPYAQDTGLLRFKLSLPTPSTQKECPHLQSLSTLKNSKWHLFENMP